jgi:Raf kinase inhibitor-like YbhB/YbcL family protein
MRYAYAVLGVGFLVLFGVLYLALSHREKNDSQVPSTPTTMPFQLTSSAFTPGGAIPSRYTCDGENIMPPLTIEGVPPGAVSLVLIIEDPDIPEAVKERLGISVFDHLVLYNIPATTTSLGEGAPEAGIMGSNTRGVGYTGPCPPPEFEPREHRYVFGVYALDAELALPPQSGKNAVKEAMKGHVLQSAHMVGRYERATSTSQE